LIDPEKEKETEELATVQRTQIREGIHEGMILEDRYVIEKELGRGGIGAVYLAHDQRLHNRAVVIKVLLQSSAFEPWFMKKFRQEIEALSRIDHPGVIGVLDNGQMPDGTPYLVMQFAEGANLRKVMKESDAPMELSRVASILRQTGAALTAAHDKGIYHCDLKPENIMIQKLGEDQEQVRLIDFGIAKVRDSQVATSTETKVAGTFQYMAPEQLMGQPSATSDVYALGVISYELLSNQHPFEARTPLALYQLQQAGPAAAVDRLGEKVPAGAQQVLFKALSFNSETRYQRAREFADDLAKALTESQPQVVQPSQQSSGRMWTLVAIVLLIAAALSAILWDKFHTPATVVGKPAAPMPVTPATVMPERILNYSITLQKYRDGKKYENPHQLAKEVLFEKDYRIRLNFSSPQRGFLYILNYGPAEGSPVDTYNVLYPISSGSNGSAELADKQEIQIPPGEDWFKFDKQEGTEKLLLIWSAKSVPELEAVKHLTNPNDNGVVRDTKQIQAIQAFLAEHSKEPAKIEREDDRTAVIAKGDVLVNLLRLEHH